MIKSKFFLLLAFLSISFVSLHAQRGPKGHSPLHMIEKHKEALNLTEAQSAALDKLRETYRTERKAKMEERRQNKGPRMDEEGNRIRPSEEEIAQRKKERKAQAAKIKQDLESILTAEQMQKLETLREEGKAKRKAFHEEMKAYNQKNVLPVLKEQRAKLEEDLSAEDKAAIAALRTEMKTKRSEMRARHQEGKAPMMEPGHRGKHPRSAGMKAENSELRDQAKALLAKHKDRIQDLMSEIESEREQWRLDRKAIAEKYGIEKDRAGKVSKKRPSSTEGVSKSRGSKPDGAGGRAFGEHKVRGHKGKKALQFLLMDPNETVKPMGTESPNAFGEAKLFPNPGNSNQKLALQVDESGKVQIDLCNQSGQVLRNVFNGTLEAGQHELLLDNGNVSSGTYQYRISGPEGIKMIPVVIQE